MSTTIVDPARLAQITHLAAGSHASVAHGACVMEAVAYVTNEPWSDRPACACPTITSYVRPLNDRMPDDQRQRLIPYIVLIAGSKASPEIELARGCLAATYAVKVFTPLALDAAGLGAAAATLRALPDITDRASALVANKAARDAHSAAAAVVYSAPAGATANIVGIAYSAAYYSAAAAAYVAGADYSADAYATIRSANAAAYVAYGAGADYPAVWDAALACLDALLAVGPTTHASPSELRVRRGDG